MQALEIRAVKTTVTGKYTVSLMQRVRANQEVGQYAAALTASRPIAPPRGGGPLSALLIQRSIGYAQGFHGHVESGLIAERSRRFRPHHLTRH